MAEDLFEVAVIMAGGRGSRLQGPSKPFMQLCGRPLLEHTLLPAVEVSRKVLIAISPHSEPYVSLFKPPPRASYIMTNGAGYESDLSLLLSLVRARPMLVLAADLIGLTPDKLSYLRRASLSAPEAVITVRDGGKYVGVSVFKEGRVDAWANLEVNWGLVNVNTLTDYGEAVERC